MAALARRVWRSRRFLALLLFWGCVLCGEVLLWLMLVSLVLLLVQLIMRL